MEIDGGKGNQAREMDQLGQSRVQHKTALVGKRKLQPYAPHGMERTN